MKYKFLNYFLLASLLLSLGGCKKKLDEVYANPNSFTKQPVESLLSGIIGNFLGSASAAGSGYGTGGDALLIGRYIQYWGTNVTSTTVNVGTQFDQMGGVQTTSDLMGSTWAMFYYGQGQNLNRMVEWGAEEQKWDYVGVGQAIRGWGWLEMANQYDNAVITREAFNTSLQQFPYDEAAIAYDSARSACYKALANLSRTDGKVNAANLAIGDAYFNNGDVTKWKKFTYGVLARYYNNFTNKAIYNADSVIYYTNLAMTTNADNAICKFAASGLSGSYNYMSPFRTNVGNIRQSAYIVNLMTGLNTTAFNGVNDPRARYMLRENPNNTLKGITPWLGASGLAAADQPNNFWGGTFLTTGAPSNDATCRYVFRYNSEYPMMTASEMQFVKAEAALRKGQNTIALAAYTNAISLNFDMLTTSYNTNIAPADVITPAMKAAYMANPNVIPTNAANLTLTHIMLQKYIALFGWGMHQTWADMRRYHYTDIDPATTKQVYADFAPPAGANLSPFNNGALVYRTRPRYNSEYLYNVPSLKLIGALNAGGSQITDYNTKRCWFTEP
jgi:Starch-binding associating with outer membrane